MKYLQIPLVILAALSTSLALADGFKTVAGKEYKESTVTRVEPDGIVVKMKSGISKVYFAELPKEVQERFHYDPQQATAYVTAQDAIYEVDARQHEEARHRQEDTDAQNNANIAKQQAANDRAQSLQDRELVREQDKALRKAKQHEEGAHTRRQRYPTLYQLPIVHSKPSSQSPKSTKSNKK